MLSRARNTNVPYVPFVPFAPPPTRSNTFLPDRDVGDFNVKTSDFYCFYETYLHRWLNKLRGGRVILGHKIYRLGFCIRLGEKMGKRMRSTIRISCYR